MVNYSFGAPSRFYPRGLGDARRPPPCASLSASAGASLATTFAACRCPQIVAFPLQPADPHAGHGCLNNRDGSRTIRAGVRAVKAFLQKIFRANYARFSGFSRHLKSSSTGDFHRWKIHPRFVENSSVSSFNRGGTGTRPDLKSRVSVPLRLKVEIVRGAYCGRPAANCAATSATRRPWKRAASSVTSSGRVCPLSLLKETP